MSEHKVVLRVTWIKSAIGYAGNQKRTIAALGLKRLHQTIEHQDTPSIRGMIATVPHLLRVEEVTDAAVGVTAHGGHVQ